MRQHRWLPLSLLLLLTTVLVACGGGGDEPAVPTAESQAATPAPDPTDTPPEPTNEPTAEPTPEESGAISSFRDAMQATIQIEAQGSFMDPEVGMRFNEAGRGSGFIVDPSGLAVTNNHVVTGAAFLQVWVQGEEDPLNARILGVSECSDLAVIDIEGDGYPYLEWHEDPPQVGVDVYALGFPLGDPEPTITRGIISKESANGDTYWASVDEVLEHDATINPGNSGGPLVTTDGEVVGVNYRGRSETSQYYAINATDARAIVERLAQGEDVNAIGINGEAVITDAGDTGIWVASVESGSPADRVGVEAGDIVTKLEGLVLSVDGTMADYCDVLRSRHATDVMSIEVLRFATQEVLEGQLNGRELEQSFSFAQAVSEDVGGDEPPTETFAEYVGIFDDSNSIFMEVPVEWSDVDGSNWVGDDGTVLGASLVASPDIDGFFTTYTTPGIEMLASVNLASSTMDELLNFFDYSADCTYDGRYEYSDPVFTGLYDLYLDCAGQGSVIAIVAAQPEDGSYAVVLVGQAVTDVDLDAFDRVLDTFNVVGTLPGQ